MDVFEKVVGVRPLIEGEEQNIAGARAALLAEIDGTSRPATRPGVSRRWVVVGGFVGAAAAVTAGVLVIGGLTPRAPVVEAIPTSDPKPSIAPSPRPTPPSTSVPLTASSAFGTAAGAARTFSAFDVGPGQYLRIDGVTEGIVFSESTNRWGEYTADRSNGTNAWRVLADTTAYRPADQHAEWRYQSASRTIDGLYGPDAGVLSLKYLQEVSTSSAPYGIAGGAGAPWPTAGGFGLADFYDAMPTDPGQLISWIDEHQDTLPEDDDTKVGWLLVELLAANGGSPEVRAVMYEALSMLDGFELVGADGNLVTVALTTSTVDVSGSPSTQRRTVTFDTTTGLVMETTYTSGAGSPLVPDDVPDLRTGYSFSIVDSAP